MSSDTSIHWIDPELREAIREQKSENEQFYIGARSVKVRLFSQSVLFAFFAVVTAWCIYLSFVVSRRYLLGKLQIDDHLGLGIILFALGAFLIILLLLAFLFYILALASYYSYEQAAQLSPIVRRQAAAIGLLDAADKALGSVSE